MNKDASTGFFSGLILGAVVGAAVALLYAPQPGVETRRMVKEKAAEVKEKAVKAAGKIKESVSSLVKGEA
ncbi:MAG: YtxH domain-containing protein [Dehalococcoidia bacterium]|nr:YtxH domain-containing protein [Dehalococcoidia bacterium]MDD5495447.1 YtxH domain-containing protein [Dehalococcoidia bacterium]